MMIHTDKYITKTLRVYRALQKYPQGVKLSRSPVILQEHGSLLEETGLSKKELLQLMDLFIHLGLVEQIQDTYFRSKYGDIYRLK